MKSLPKLVIFGDTKKSPVAQAIEQFSAFAKGKAETLAIYNIETFKEGVSETRFAKNQASVLEKADYAIVFGGDGSMISTARNLCGASLPVIGVNLGAQPVDAAGLVFSDGDATDIVKAFPGQTGTIIQPGGYALILDPEYTGFYPIPAGAIWLSPSNTTLGNSLTTNDPITLMAHDGIAVVSTFLAPFNPGNGISAERIDLAAADTPDNWLASPCGSSPGAPNCAR